MFEVIGYINTVHNAILRFCTSTVIILSVYQWLTTLSTIPKKPIFICQAGKTGGDRTGLVSKEQKKGENALPTNELSLKQLELAARGCNRIFDSLTSKAPLYQ